jgi:hypothetical protein
VPARALATLMREASRAQPAPRISRAQRVPRASPVRRMAWASPVPRMPWGQRMSPVRPRSGSPMALRARRRKAARCRAWQPVGQQHRMEAGAGVPPGRRFPSRCQAPNMTRPRRPRRHEFSPVGPFAMEYNSPCPAQARGSPTIPPPRRQPPTTDPRHAGLARMARPWLPPARPGSGGALGAARASHHAGSGQGEPGSISRPRCGPGPGCARSPRPRMRPPRSPPWPPRARRLGAAP